MSNKTIAIGSDHAGFALKENLKELLNELGIKFKDFGTTSVDSVDYTDYAQKVSKEVSSGNFQLGILICATGIGMSMVANRFKGVRAALVTNNLQAELARKHNKANVVIFGSKITSPSEAKVMLKIWLEAEFEGGRHERRINKIDNICKE